MNYHDNILQSCYILLSSARTSYMYFIHYFYIVVALVFVVKFYVLILLTVTHLYVYHLSCIVMACIKKFLKVFKKRVVVFMLDSEM